MPWLDYASDHKHKRRSVGLAIDTNFISVMVYKPFWFLGLVLSVIYLVIFLLVFNGTIDSPGHLLGFCVWGAPGMPDEFHGCTNAPINSHTLSFGVDLLMTLVTGIVWQTSFARGSSIVYIFCGTIILFHGLLHWLLQQTMFDFFIINCHKLNIGGNLEVIGNVIFGIFTFCISIVILGNAGCGMNPLTVIGSSVVAFAVIAITKGTDNDFILPGLFCLVHLLTCIVGLYSTASTFNEKVGALFALCTMVGIVELSACEDFLRPYGGHVWYDFTLDVAMITSAYFTDDSPETREH